MLEIVDQLQALNKNFRIIKQFNINLNKKIYESYVLY